MDPAVKTSPETLLLWRERMGLNQHEAAAALGCARNSIQTWEKDEARVPKYIRLAMAALALGIKVD